MVEHQSAALSRIFSALADPTRRAILARLGEGESSITDLAGPFRMTFAAVSKHVGVLESAGLVSRRWEGRIGYCRLEPAALATADEWIAHYRRFWGVRLDALDTMFHKKGRARERPKR